MKSKTLLRFTVTVFLLTAIPNALLAIVLLLSHFFDLDLQFFVSAPSTEPESLVMTLIGAIIIIVCTFKLLKGSHAARKILALFCVLYIFQTGWRVFIMGSLSWSLRKSPAFYVFSVQAGLYLVIFMLYLMSLYLFLFSGNFYEEIENRRQAKK